MRQELTLNEVFALFGRTPDQTRWLASAESEEYLTLVTYLVARLASRKRRII